MIAAVVKRAYADMEYSDHREDLMVERLRATPAFVPALSVLAEVHSEPVGDVLLTRALIRTERATVVTLALAPLAVVPELRGTGVGSRPVRMAHQEAAALGFGSIVLVGIAGYF